MTPTQQAQEKAREMFTSRFAEAGVIGDRKLQEYLPNTFNSMLEHIDDLVAQTIKDTEERIVGEIEQISDFADSEDTLKKRIINLINK